ncbi:MAG: helix-turn-helix transcriptional regulator [Ruminococcaceae bacterium]|nr:helix-turn-helix transcriptional regulator [Oscillospiraceae bacterium]
MKTKNICKFIYEPSFDKLDTHCFIYETEISAMNKPNILKFNRIILVKNGEFTFFINNRQFKAETGRVIFAFAGESFYANTKLHNEYLYIDFDGNRADILFKRLGINASNRIFDGLKGLIPFWHNALTSACEGNIDLAAESALLYTLSKLNAIPNKENILIQQIIDITEDDFMNPNLSITTIAEKLSYNSKYLSHLFKVKMNISYTEYLRMHRIKYATFLIEHGIDSVKSIASLCGFSNPFYFSSVFKKTVGIPPTEYNKDKNK